ncbi:hypothetical protein K1T35_47410 (plasmid) [Pseudonocardia sp. DSM 110487]|uniref:hypothetical protein n=1 Tax=Pseudonocardia sp. DSM 110487 TaxID=2865833 RepID=UPI001C696DDC|nr:hypothetical protein [Pseudonocardia sp. DSM 110487]QYN40978.1 hypothetical protein K1T35_47410 [Pseudonocardia sp. DSM 110487]
MNEARELTTDLSEAHRIARWINENGGHASIPFLQNYHHLMSIRMRRGVVVAGVGDRIVRGSDGEFRVTPGGCPIAPLDDGS